MFTGSVVDRTETDHGYEVSLDVLEGWKGEPGTRATVLDERCIVSYRVGEQYLV